MYLIVGAGLSGAVIAERIANVLNEKVIIIDKRDHIGGNCYDYVDTDTGIRINKYGAHLFHTNHQNVWEYVKKFCNWIHWEHKVIANVNDKLVPVPCNIETVNTLLNLNINNDNDMQLWLSSNVVQYDNINNSEELAKSRIGEKLYELLIKNYTYKQWNKYPNELDKVVLNRLPFRTNFDSRYFNDKYQALPEKGYTHFFERLFDNPLIDIRLKTCFFDFKKDNDISKFTKVIYTGPIDSFFEDMPKLEYRSIDFIMEKLYNVPYFQTNSVVNYPLLIYPYTRIVEYKHFLNQKSDHTVIVYETTKEDGEPYYPVPSQSNLDTYKLYQDKCLEEEKNNNYIFLGRLATYKYINMDEAILLSLNKFDELLINVHT
jgi:UDP-galactopyranose mutase